MNKKMELNKVFNYSYYKNLGFDNFESWKESDLSQFLVLDLLNTFSNTTISKDMSGWLVNSYEHFSQKSKKYQNILGFIDWIFLRFVSFFEGKKNKEKILFVSSDAFTVLGVKKYYSLKFIVRRTRDRLFAIRNFIGYITTTDLVQYVSCYLKERKTEYLYALMKNVEVKLKVIKPNYIIFSNDALPIERAIILVSKKLGITTMEIQHGVYDQSMSFSVDGEPPAAPLVNGQAADYILVWGEYFKDLYIKQKTRNPEDIYILGYPDLIKKDNGARGKNNHYTVCYLSQNFEAYDKSFLATKLETLKKLSELCKKLNLEFICRPHPGDDRGLLIEKLPYVRFTPEKEELEQTFKRADVLISFNSSALIQAAMKSKVCLQLMNYPIKSDNYEKLGVCSKSVEAFTELEYYLKKISDASNLDEFRTKFNNKYAETRYNPGQRLLEILKEIKGKVP